MKVLELDEMLEIVEEAKEKLELYHEVLETHWRREDLADLIARIDNVIFTIDKTI